MTQSITNAIVKIAEVVAGVDGINAPQATPRENTAEYPMAMVYLFDGQLTSPGNGWTEDLVNIAIDILMPHQDLNEELPILHPILDDTKIALWSEVATTAGAGTHFDNSIDTFGNLAVAFIPGNYLYAGAEMVGYRLIIEQVKITGTLP